MAVIEDKPFPFRSPAGTLALVIEIEKARYTFSIMLVRCDLGV